MYNFNFVRPASLDEAVSVLRENGEAKLLAGGQTLIPTLKQGLAMPSDLVDLGTLQQLKGIAEREGELVIGAGERHADVAGSALVRNSVPALAELAEQIGDPPVRHLGTLGGSIANNDPSADYPAGVLGLGATVQTTKRTIAAEDFFRAMFETALDPDEIITHVRFPVPEKAAYAKFPNPASRYAVVGVFVSCGRAGVRVAVTGAGPGVFRLPQMEAALAESFTAEALADITVSAEGLSGDMHASAEFRAHLITVMARRAVGTACRR